MTAEQREWTRLLAWEGCLNARDLGGYQTGDGRETRWGTVVRSDSPVGPTERFGGVKPYLRFSWMTAADRCAGHVGGTTGENDRGSGLAGGGARLREVRPDQDDTSLVGKRPEGARQGTTLPEVRSPPGG